MPSIPLSLCGKRLTLTICAPIRLAVGRTRCGNRGLARVGRALRVLALNQPAWILISPAIGRTKDIVHGKSIALTRDGKTLFWHQHGRGGDVLKWDLSKDVSEVIIKETAFDTIGKLTGMDLSTDESLLFLADGKARQVTIYDVNKGQVHARYASHIHYSHPLRWHCLTALRLWQAHSLSYRPFFSPRCPCHQSAQNRCRGAVCTSLRVSPG